MDSETRQRLLELVYDLLPEDEAAELRGQNRSRIPKWPRPIARRKRPRGCWPRLPGSRPRAFQPIQFAKATMPAEDRRVCRPSPRRRSRWPRAGATAGQSFARAANWTVGLAAAALVLISVGGYFYHREKLAAIAAEHLRLVVTGPSTIQAGVATEYLVSTTDDQRPAAARQGRGGAVERATARRLKAFKETADEHGRLQVAIPADLKLPPETQFRVVAWHGDEPRGDAEATLAVEPAALRRATRSGSAALSAGRHGPLPLAGAFAFRFDGRPRRAGSLRDSRSGRRRGCRFAARCGEQARRGRRRVCHPRRIGRRAIHAGRSRRRRRVSRRRSERSSSAAIVCRG